MTVTERDTTAVEKMDENHVYPEIQVQEIVEISQRRDPIRNLCEKVRGRGRMLRRRVEIVKQSDAAAPDPQSASSSLPFRRYPSFEDLA